MSSVSKEVIMSSVNVCKKFVIVTLPRSGSNYLSSLLNSHPEILCHLELFHKDAIYYAIGRNNDMDMHSIEVRNNNPITFLSSLWKKTFDKKTVGFKIFDGHNAQILEHVLLDESIKKLLLIRRDIVRTYISTVIAEMTGEYCKLENVNIGTRSLPRFCFDIQAFFDYAQQMENFYVKCEAKLIDTNQTYLKVYYPDILDKSIQQQILEFLGVTDNFDGLHSKFIKQDEYRLKDIITNLEEVRSALSGTKYNDDFK